MTLSFKRFVPYSRKEVKHGIRGKALNEDWKISLKCLDDEDDFESFRLTIRHLKSKLESPQLEIHNRANCDKRKQEYGYLTVYHHNKPIFHCKYGQFTTNIFKALETTMRNPHFIVDVMNLKTKRTPFIYCTEKFGPIFEDMRCSQWQLPS